MLEMIPFHRPLIDESEITAVTECLRSGWLTTGQRAMEFEKKFAEYVGAPHAVACNSCTAAMHLALAAMGLGPGDEVITTPYTFVATCEAIQYIGAKPVFVDIDPKTLNMNPDLLKLALTARTRAIVPVHFAGHPVDMAKVMAFARAHNLKVLEDAAHAIEAAITAPEPKISDGGLRVSESIRMNNKPSAVPNPQSAIGKIGTISEATCFSFYATKNLTTAEGGMITCSDPDLAAHMRRLCLHGLSRDAWKRYTSAGSWYYEVLEQGYKYNLTDIAASIGLAQLAKLEKMWHRREEIASYYNEAFAAMPELEIPTVRPNVRHGWHLYVLRLRLEKLAINRRKFFEEMRERGVNCSVHFIPLHLMPYYHKTYGLRPGDFPEAERQFERVISLPLYPALTDREIERVIEAVKQIVAENLRPVRTISPSASPAYETRQTAFV